MARTIQSPGVEINEVDLSLRPVIPTGTSILVSGFASQGPTEEVFEVTSLSEFETVYGKPQSPAERYFYQTAKAVFSSDARVLATRVPYGSGAGLGYGETYTALFFPVYCHNTADAETFNTAATGQGALAAGISLSAVDSHYVFCKPTMIELNKDQYERLQRGDFVWDNAAKCNAAFSETYGTWGRAGMIVTNKAKSTINDKYEGFYLGLADNSQLNPATDFDSILSHVSVSENSRDLTLSVPETRRNFPLSGTSTSNDNSVSETMENIPTFDISTDEFKDTLIAGVFKLRTSVFATDTIKLDYILAESHLGSLDSYRMMQNVNGGSPKTFFLGNVEDSSSNIEVFVNPHIAVGSGSWLDSGSNNPSKAVRVLTNRALTDSASFSLSGSFGVPKAVLDKLVTTFDDGTKSEPADILLPLGAYQLSNPKSNEIGNVPTKLNRILRSIENVDAVNIDITTEGGLGTIFAGSEVHWNEGVATAIVNDNVPERVFDDERHRDIGTISSSSGLYKLSEGLVSGDNSEIPYRIQQNWRAVFNEFNAFTENKRKDCLHIADAPRWIFVNGKNEKALDDKSRTFTQAVYWPLRHILGAANTSYATVYGNWGRVYDSTADKAMWSPFSGTAAATLANSDSTYAPWWAPAGFSRGRFIGLNDLAVTPTQKHRDQLYKINVNPVHQFPNEGFVIWGQKTLFKKPSAFDRLNVRRLFLYLEKLVRNSMKFYVFEPNTLLTRTQVLNGLTPAFERVKQDQGMYDYLIICDERNNTPDRIDQNELIVDIYIKPVRAAEFILVNFYATRTGQDFNELMY